MIRPSESPHAICFASSYLHWLTRAEASHGWFRLDACLQWLPQNPRQSLSYVLAAQVPAGRMYAPTGPLLKQPPYSFQLIAGREEHTILRRSLTRVHDPDLTDTTQPHQITFQELSWNLRETASRQLSLDALFTFPDPPPILNLLLQWNGPGWRLILQAPLRHWNQRITPHAWQIETGPILWPLDLEAFMADPSSSKLTTAWLHANRDSHVTISGDRLPSHELVAHLSLLELH